MSSEELPVLDLSDHDVEAVLLKLGLRAPNNIHAQALRDALLYDLPPTFWQYINLKAKGVYPFIHLLLSGIILKFTTDSLISWGIVPLEGTSNASLTFAEAFKKCWPGIMHMDIFILAYSLILMLVHSNVVAATVVSLFPPFYFTSTYIKAPNWNVIIRGTSMSLPMFWFQFLVAILFYVLEVLAILLVLFLSWKYMPSTTPSEAGESNGISNINGPTLTEEIVSDTVEMVTQAVQQTSDGGTGQSNPADMV